MRAYSYRQLAFMISVILTFVAGFILFLGYYLNNTLSFLFIFLPVFVILCYLILISILKRYISEKIKPVYKTILDLPVKIRKQDNNPEKGSDILTEAKADVEAWAKIQTQEIERLKELERYRKEFVGNVSHELKTPIFNIQGYVLTLLEGGINDPKINKLYLKRTEKSIDRLISIVEDLESITKLEAGELRLNQERFDIVRMVEEVFDMQQMFAYEQQVSLEFSQRQERPVFVFADRKRITEVLNNLINNGIKYCKKKGFIKVGFYDMEEHIMVEVADNGIGIEKKELKRVFERFYRVDKSRSRDQGGTGLGLSIVKHIIEAHNQTINVRSVVDEGTTFTFTLEKAR
jgi:two-component system, OmpR family, phosphate regulon sensor histidine kinase PhoR